MSIRPASMTAERYFYTTAALGMLVVTFLGFHPYYLAGQGMGGRQISPDLFSLVLVHAIALTAWMLLFFVQALLIKVRSRRLHMNLGWVGAVVALAVAISGCMLAVQSVRSAPSFAFWGMAYRQFLLVMLAEMALFTAFVVAGVLWRKRREKHRAMMLLATLSILAGATVRMPVLFPLFGEAGWMGVFGPIFALGGAFLVARSVLIRRLDRPLAAGYAILIAFYVAACQFAVSGAWSYLAAAVFRT
jgi:hypothetical protein